MTKHNHVESHSASQTHKSEHQGNYAGHHHKIRSEHHDDPLLEAQTACSKLLSCASDTWARSKRASEVVGGGMINGAVKEAQKEFKHPEQLAKHAWDAGVAHVS